MRGWTRWESGIRHRKFWESWHISQASTPRQNPEAGRACWRTLPGRRSPERISAFRRDLSLIHILNSVKKTHRLCIVHEAVKQGGFGAEISATVAEEAMEYLDAPILRYGAPFCPIPFAPTLEKMVKVVPEDLVKGIKGMF